jgi:signal transduction histidine kinase
VLRTVVQESARPDAEIDLADTVSADVSVVADDLLPELFANLVGNAIKHNDADRPRVCVTVDESDGDVVVRVADNGPGIPDEQKTELFGTGPGTDNSDGTGVGLYLVETLVDRYGGDIWVENNDPRGAVFAVRLCRAD